MILVELYLLPKMANGGHGSWHADHAQKKAIKRAMGTALLGKLPAKPWPQARAVFTRYSSVEPDDDGLVHGFKAVRDSLKLYGVILDDHPRCLTSTYRWERVPPKRGKIRVEVYPLI